jgi:hypothetical protein
MNRVQVKIVHTEQCRRVETGEEGVLDERMNKVWVKNVNSVGGLKLVNRR